MSDAALDVLSRIEGIAHPEAGRSLRHELHEPAGASAGRDASSVADHGRLGLWGASEAVPRERGRSRSASHSTYGSAAGLRGLRAAICPAPYKSRTTPASGATRRATVTSRTLAFLPDIILGIGQRSDQTAGIR